MKKYKYFSILIGFVVIVLSSLSIIYFSFFPKEGLVFLKRHYTNSQDVYTYVSFIEQAKQGKILFENLFTSEPQEPSLFRPSYLLIGKFASITHLSSIDAYHISRVIFSVLFLLTLYKFLGYFFKDDKNKFITFVLIITSSGLGFLVYKWIPNSTDLWIPEGNTFLSLGEAPHFILSQTLMLLGFISFLNYLKDKKVIRIVLSSLLFLLLSFEHPFNLIVIAPTLLLTALWSEIPLINAILISFGSSIGLIYQYYESLKNPILASWQVQNVLLSPQPFTYLLGYGLIIYFVFIEIENHIKTVKFTPFYKFLLVWVTTTAILVYAPVNFQRRFIEGVHIPFGILATSGLLYFVSKQKEKYRSNIITGTIVLMSLTSIFMIYSDFSVINNDKQGDYYYHIDKSETDSIYWLMDQTGSQDIILSNWYIGNIIPGITGRKVYLGHQIQTSNWTKKNADLDVFVNNRDLVTSKKFIDDNRITYIFIGKNDILIKNGFKPENYPEIKSVYNKDGVTIYKVETTK